MVDCCLGGGKKGGGYWGDFQGHSCKAITINMEQLKLGEETMEGGEGNSLQYFMTDSIGEECNSLMFIKHTLITSLI